MSEKKFRTSDERQDLYDQVKEDSRISKKLGPVKLEDYVDTLRPHKPLDTNLDGEQAGESPGQILTTKEATKR